MRSEERQMEATIDELIAAKSQLANELEEAKERIAQLERENAKLEGERDNLDDQITRARGTFSDIMEKCQSLEKDAEQLRVGLNDIYGDARLAEQA